MSPRAIRFPKKSNGVKKAIREGRLKVPTSPHPFKEDHVPWNKDKTGVYSESTLNLMSQRALKPERVDIAIGNLPKNLRGSRHPLFGKHISEETKEKISAANTGNTYSLGHKHKEETKAKLSLIAKARHEDPEYTKRVMKSRRPTDIEAKLIEIIQRYKLPYRYTGNGSFLIGRFNPDFVNINCKKIAIDVFGDYWHEADEVLKRKKTFAEYGWKLVILWGHEMKGLPEAEIVSNIEEWGK